MRRIAITVSAGGCTASEAIVLRMSAILVGTVSMLIGAHPRAARLGKMRGAVTAAAGPSAGAVVGLHLLQVGARRLVAGLVLLGQALHGTCPAARGLPLLAGLVELHLRLALGLLGVGERRERRRAG